MNKSESSLWRWLRETHRHVKLSRTELQMTRIENSVGSGLPDVEGIYQGSQFWLELKVAGRPAHSTTEVDVKHLRPKQVEWLHNRWLADGNAWILLRVEGGRTRDPRLYLIPGKHARAVRAGLTEFELSELSHISTAATRLSVVAVASRK